jgi:MFS family permease
VPSSNAEQRAQPARLLPYCIVAGSMSLGYGSIYTLLADLRDRYGFTEAELGAITAAGFLAGFVAQLALARLADRGYAPLLVRGGILLAMGAMIGSAAATEFWAFLVARLLLGLGSGAVGPAMRRIVITRRPDAVGDSLGRLASFDVAGFVLGPLIAGGVAEALGIRAPFIFLAGVFVGVFVLASRLDLTAGVAGAHAGHALRSLIVRPQIQATLAASIAFYLTVGMFEAIWAVLLRDHGAETWLIALTLSMFTVPMIFLAPIGGRTAQSRGPLRVVAVSLSVAALCTFSYGVLPSLWMLLAVSLVHAVADSFTMPSNQVAAALGSPPEHLSAAQGLLGATGLAAAGLTGLVAGFVYEEAGRLAVCTGTAVLMAVFLTVGLTLGRRELAGTPEMVGTDEPLAADAIGSGVPDLP